MYVLFQMANESKQLQPCIIQYCLVAVFSITNVIDTCRKPPPIMHLSVIVLGYLGSQFKDTPHLGGSQIVRFGISQLREELPEEILMQLLGVHADQACSLADALYLGESIVEQGSAISGLHAIDTQHHLLVQPVSLQVQRDRVFLSEIVRLSAEEYEVLSDLFNQHFAEEGIKFIQSTTQQYWFIELGAALQCNTYLAQKAIYQDVHPFKLKGLDAKMFNKIMNETQMLLHEHPINERRQAQQKAAVNSVWCSGNARFSVDPEKRVSALVGQGALIKGLARYCQLPLLADFHSLNQLPEHVLVLSETMHGVDWNQLFQMVKKRTVNQLTIYLPNMNHTLQIQLSPWDCWKFWKRLPNLEQFI